MAEPFYIRQTAEPMSVDQQRAWFQSCADEAKADGATHARFSIHPRDARMLLTEAWNVRPTDEGDPRWSLQKAV